MPKKQTDYQMLRSALTAEQKKELTLVKRIGKNFRNGCEFESNIRPNIPSTILSCSFVWLESPQGVAYWSAIYEGLVKVGK